MTKDSDEALHDRPWEPLSDRLDASDDADLAGLLNELDHEEQRLALSRLSESERTQLLESLEPELAADLLEHLPDAQAADILEEIAPESAADIVEALREEISADLLREMDPEDSDAVLAEMDSADEADQLRERVGYAWDTAGGLMTRSFAAFEETATVAEVLDELGENAERYEDLDVQYVYITTAGGLLKGVLPLRDLVMTPRRKPVAEVMIARPESVFVGDSFEALKKIFDERSFLGLPVIDESGLLVGIVTRHAFDEAISEHQTEDYLLASGIVGGEELRSMPMPQRCLRRLAWLAPNIVLNLVAASIIALYEDTLQAVIALAVFLPIVSDMSGCSGNQAVAVSIRELTLGLLRPHEFLRVMWKEGILGIVNGLVLGLLLGSLAALWKDNIWLGVVIAGSLALNTVMSVLLGGCVPLLLKRFKVDPALASGPILTTCTDMCGFFLVLNLASSVLTKLT